MDIENLRPHHPRGPASRPVQIPVRAAIEERDAHLLGDLTLPPDPKGLVIFAHGSGSSRLSPRNRAVADYLVRNEFGTLLMDLLTQKEEVAERFTRHLRFDINLLADRLVAATDFARRQYDVGNLRIGYFGASTGAAAALVAASRRPEEVRAVVSRGGRPDLAGSALPFVTAPTLLIVGAADHGVIELNEQALAQMPGIEAVLELVPRATHLFEEPGTLQMAADLARNWFATHLPV